jgi:hypothetical protein
MGLLSNCYRNAVSVHLQSPKVSADELDNRIELFLVEFEATLSALSTEEFQVRPIVVFPLVARERPCFRFCSTTSMRVKFVAQKIKPFVFFRRMTCV